MSSTDKKLIPNCHCNLLFKVNDFEMFSLNLRRVDVSFFNLWRTFGETLKAARIQDERMQDTVGRGDRPL